MLVLTRYENESIRIGDDVTVTILQQVGRRTKIGIEAPRHIPVHRSEVTQRHDFRNAGAKTKPAVTPVLANANPTGDGQ